MKITIRAGQARLLYTDRIDLAALGQVTITRASNVEYDPALRGWTVTLADGTALPGTWAKRHEALAVEVAYLEARL